MKRYTIELEVQESSHEFWEELKGKTGIEEVLESVRVALEGAGFCEEEIKISLTGFVWERSAWEVDDGLS